MKKFYKNLIVIACIVLALSIVAAGVGWLTDGFQKWNPKEWFPEDIKDVEEDVSVIGDGTALLEGKLYNMPSSLTFLNATSSEGIALIATILPEDATNKAVDWYVSWVNPLSPWAQDKNVTDYVTVTPLSDGGNIANVVCVDSLGFNEQIKITVVLRRNSNLFATCSVDFVQRFLSFGVAVSDLGVYVDDEPCEIDVSKGFEYSLDTVVYTTNGTIPIEGTESIMYMFNLDPWVEALTAEGIYAGGMFVMSYEGPFTFISLLKYYAETTDNSELYERLCNDEAFFIGLASRISLTVKIVCRSNYENYERFFMFDLLFWSSETPASSVTLSEGQIIY